MKKISIVLLVLCVMAAMPAFAGSRKLGAMPAPRLISPSDETDVSGRQELEFRWSSETGGNFDHYDFRVYKGTQTYEKGLLLKKEIPKGTTSIFLETSLFETGQHYAWSLRSVGSTKSRSSYSIFFIKK